MRLTPFFLRHSTPFFYTKYILNFLVITTNFCSTKFCSKNKYFFVSKFFCILMGGSFFFFFCLNFFLSCRGFFLKFMSC